MKSMEYESELFKFSWIYALNRYVEENILGWTGIKLMDICLFLIYSFICLFHRVF